MVGQVCVGLAQPLFMSAPTKLAREWFAPEQRGLATSFAVLSNTIGMAIPFLAALGVTRAEDISTFSLMLLVFAGLQPLFLVWALFVAEESEDGGETPSTASQGRVEATSIFSLVELRIFVTNAPLLGVTLAYTFVVGGFWSLATEVESLLLPHNFTHGQISEAGAIFLWSGATGLVCNAFTIDRLSTSKVAVVATICTSLSYVWLVSSLDSTQFNMLCIACALLGFFASAVQPVLLQEAARLAMPGTGEGTSSGILVALACLVYVLESSLAPVTMLKETDSSGFATLLLVTNILATICLLLCYAVSGDWGTTGSDATASTSSRSSEAEMLRKNPPVPSTYHGGGDGADGENRGRV